MDIREIALFIQVAIFLLILCITVFYSISILFLDRRDNLLTLNICLATTMTCCYFIIYFLLYIYNPEVLLAENRCHFLLYAYNISSIGVPFSFVTISVDRYVALIYHRKHFFKTKQWLTICIGTQWAIEFIISLPFVLRKGQYCIGASLMTIYTWVMAVLLPLLVNITLNSYILLYVRSSSSHRVAPQFEHRSIDHNQRPTAKLTRRHMHLLVHMIVMFSLFLVGWGPVYTVLCLRLVVNLHPLIFSTFIVLGELCLLGIIIDLFVYNHKLRHRLSNSIRQCFERLFS